MDNSTALIQAASGLERLMLGNKNNTILKDSTVAQISAFMYYNANVISKLTVNKAFQSKFSSVIFTQIDKDFGEYMDALARTRPKSLHHVYEWKKVGNKTARLFELNIASQEGLSFKIATQFKMSKSLVPSSGNNKRRHVFANKAAIMEEGKPLVISPKYAKQLVFEMDGETVFMPKGKSVTVKRPGGSASTNQFLLAHGRFFSGNLVGIAIRNSGFQKIFNAGMAKALKIPVSIKKVQFSFKPNAIKAEAEASMAAAFGASL